MLLTLSTGDIFTPLGLATTFATEVEPSNISRTVSLTIKPAISVAAAPFQCRSPPRMRITGTCAPFGVRYRAEVHGPRDPDPEAGLLEIQEGRPIVLAPRKRPAHIRDSASGQVSGRAPLVRQAPVQPRGSSLAGST